MKLTTRLLSVVAFAALSLAATQCRRANQEPAAKAPENPPAAATQQAPEPASQAATATPQAAALPGFALIPAGKFIMGDALDGDKKTPQHQVNVSAFYLRQHEVSKAEWDEVRAWGAEHGYSDLPEGKGKAASHPVQTVSWNDVVKWCNAKSEQEGLTPCYYTDAAQTVPYRAGQAQLAGSMVKWSAKGYRLPTEAEWEKAARGGLDGKRFPWGDKISHHEANFNNAEGAAYVWGTANFHPAAKVGGMPYTSPVGSFAANGYGLYDMAGNVWEWCWDGYGDYPSVLETDPRGAASGLLRVVRGGGWYYYAENCRVASRCFYDPGETGYSIGFRVARSAVP